MSANTVVFIAGMSRSGSTLLDRLLGQIPGWWAIGEVVHLWSRGVLGNESCGCGERFLECPVWDSIGREAFGGWDAIDAREAIRLRESVARDRFTPLLLAPRMSRRFSRELDAYNEILSRLYAAVRAVTGASVVVDSGKHTAVALAMRHNKSLDLRVVHLIRDSRGVAYSLSKVKARPAAGADAMMHRWSPLESSLRYLAYNSLLSATFRSDRLLARYEDLVEHPEVSVSGICAWAMGGDCPHEIHFEDPPQLRLGHGISGNPVRSRSGLVRLTEDKEWTWAMDWPTRLLVTAITSPTLLQSHYPLRRPSGARTSR